jgi:outer membrane receptor for ferrienterochelin and colicin
MKMLKKLFALFVLFIAVTTTATYAQQTGTITGNVKDSATDRPMVGASVVVAGTHLGTTTDAKGNFSITSVPAGAHKVIVTYVGYGEATREAQVAGRGVVKVEVFLHSASLRLQEVVVYARDPESESGALVEQKEALVVVQTVGASEMSRKGTGDAEAAVAQVSGVSKQEGAKNVFVRGLGDRYNRTLLNGFPVPSEDPEYKNIALEFFATDIIKNIGVSKVFSAENNGDVGGAVVDINSKELSGRQAFSVGLDAGVNSRAVGATMLRLDGVNFLGHSNNTRPADGKYDFANSLDPSRVKLPLSNGISLSGGKCFLLGGGMPLSFFVVGTHSTDYSHTRETVRGAGIDGALYEDLSGEKSSIGINQLVLANVGFHPSATGRIVYNFMLLHNNDQYVGRYWGKDSGTFPDNPELGYRGFIQRQQSNDNLLTIHQLTGRFDLGERLQTNIGLAYNTIRGTEPDRRENPLTLGPNGYYLTGSDHQRRQFSQLKEHDVNLRADLRWALGSDVDIEKSNVTAGYKGRFVEDSFGSEVYVAGITDGIFDIDGLRLDDVYNQPAYENGDFRLKKMADNRYDVSKTVHSAFVELNHSLSEKFAANVGLQIDRMDMDVDHDVQFASPGRRSLDKTWLLPSLNLRWSLTELSTLRLGASKSYILPQAKEISPYKYINIGFSSQGNQNINPSECYNFDLRWECYPAPMELLSVGVFYKHITDPIGRVDQLSSAGTLTYNNISPKAEVAGVEFELRKNLLGGADSKLSAGLNASYIYSNLRLDIRNTAPRYTQLEGASPWIANADLTYSLLRGERLFTATMVVNYTGDRISTLGAGGYYDVIEKGVVTLSTIASYKFSSHWGVKLKAANLLDPSYRSVRKYGDGSRENVLDEYKKGMGISVGISYDYKPN